MLNRVVNWLTENEGLIQRVGNVSFILLIITVIVLPVVVKQLPADYFVRAYREPAWRDRKYPMVWGVISLVKNLLGVLLILVGIAMLVLPGQGTVTILIGLAISNFPGKYALERRIAGQPAVGATLNKIRQLTGAPPLQMPVRG